MSRIIAVGHGDRISALPAPPGEIAWNDSDLTRQSDNRIISSVEEDGWTVFSSSLTYMVEDAGVPFYAPNIAERVYLEGAPAGSGRGMARSVSGEPTILHAGVLLKVSENFVNDAANLTKIFYLWSAGQSKFILSLTGGQNFNLAFLLRHSPGNTAYMGATEVPQSEARCVPGQWHVVEFRVESASEPEMGGSADGRGRVWLDGVLTHDIGGLDTHFIGQSRHWTSAEWNTIRGGTGPDNPEDMRWWAGALMTAVGGS